MKISSFHRIDNLFIREIIGTGYKSYPLKPLKNRIEQWFKKPSQRLPYVTLIKTTSGNKYKLLTVNTANIRELDRIRKILYILKKLDFVPKIIFSDNTHLLVEYIDEYSADVSSKEFASSFGKNLAVIHNINIGQMSSEKFTAHIKEDIKYLTDEGVLSTKISRKIHQALTLSQPEGIRTSMDYVDLKESNFVFDREKKLFFVDLGGFRDSAITGQSLVGKPFLGKQNFYDDINRDIFRDEYIQSGGSKFIFEHELFLSATFLLAKIAHCLRNIRQRPLCAWSSKRLYSYAIKFGIPKLIRMIS
jgi:hypothetical protein